MTRKTTFVIYTSFSEGQTQLGFFPRSFEEAYTAEPVVLNYNEEHVPFRAYDIDLTNLLQLKNMIDFEIKHLLKDVILT